MWFEILVVTCKNYKNTVQEKLCCEPRKTYTPQMSSIHSLIVHMTDVNPKYMDNRKKLLFNIIENRLRLLRKLLKNVFSLPHFEFECYLLLGRRCYTRKLRLLPD